MIAHNLENKYPLPSLNEEILSSFVVLSSVSGGREREKRRNGHRYEKVFGEKQNIFFSFAK